MKSSKEKGKGKRKGDLTLEKYQELEKKGMLRKGRRECGCHGKMIAFSTFIQITKAEANKLP
jgi:hypothetical protein